MIGVVDERLHMDDARSHGYVLDGFPRTVAQAEALAAITDGELEMVIDLDVPTEVVLPRLAGRRVCKNCGTNYSVDEPPTSNWTCDKCGGEVVQREDDKEEAIQRRLDLYEEVTTPLTAWYAERDLLVVVDGMGDPDEVTARLLAAIDAKRG
jgi:adenylate kinase